MSSLGHVQSGAKQLLSKLLDAPVGKRVQTETISVNTLGVVLIVLLNQLDILLEQAVSVELDLSAEICFA